MCNPKVHQNFYYSIYCHAVFLPVVTISVLGSGIMSSSLLKATMSISSCAGEHNFEGMNVDGAWILAITSSGDKVLTQLKQAHFPKEQILRKD